MLEVVCKKLWRVSVRIAQLHEGEWKALGQVHMHWLPTYSLGLHEAAAEHLPGLGTKMSLGTTSEKH